MITADEALHLVNLEFRDPSVGDSHASHAQNAHDGQLGFPPHVQLVYEEDRQYTHGEIT